MVIINYILKGEKGENCNFLEIPENNRIKLLKLINKVKEFEKNIEVNIVKLGQLKYEVDNDHRIHAKLSNDIKSMYGLGKRFLQEELNTPFKNEKICYCCHDRNFDNTILTIFHELNHFRNPFDLGLYYTQFEIDPNKLSLEKYLKCNIEIALNEFFAEYRVVKQLASYEEFRERLINQAEGYLKRSFAYTLPDRNKFTQMFNAGFIRIFRFLGCWQGFYEIGDASKLDEMWDQFILNFYNSLVNPKIFKSIKSILFKNQKDAISIFEIFKTYFNKVFNLTL